MCVLKMTSDTFSFKGIAESTSIQVCSVADLGEVKNPKTGEKHVFNWISFNVSDAEWDEFPNQVEDAEKFLKQWRGELKDIIGQSPNIEGFLDFPLWSRLDGNIVNQNDYLPRALIALAGEIGLGIEMSKYAVDAFDSLDSGTHQSQS